MKTFLASLSLATAVFAFAGCESDMPPDPHEENPVQRGLRGEGQLIQPDAAQDPTQPTGEIPPPNN